MKMIIRILGLLFLTSCESNSVKITGESDLKNLAGVFNIELQLAKINPICSEAGLEEVEKFLEGKSEAEQQAYVLKIGAYVGECIIQSYGGKWIEYEPGIWAIQLSENNLAFPIGKVQKFVDDPVGNSFSSFYGVIPMLREELQKN